MAIPDDRQDPNTTVPRDGETGSEAGGRAKSPEPNTTVPQDQPEPNTTVPQDNS